ncbi:MAG TPA: SDR family NAD(P)-dependent oxidoreductase [Patescibacteria group bacterium]|nr:SDR family NAD(P)-dependent oxidoreductase [Patescibacteria group bacterium]
MQSLKGRIAVVTGASRGIGKAICLKLAENEVNLAINSSSAKSLEPIQKELSQFGIDVLPCPANLADEASPGEIIRKAGDYFGRIDILINNAGISIPKPLSETTANEWDLQMAVNARAPFLLSRSALPYLRQSDAGTIINISSVVGCKGYVNQGAYTASKHALMGMTKVLAQEVFGEGIRVHVIAPGAVSTDMIVHTRPDLDASMLTNPEEIADIALFILTHRGTAVIDEINVHRYTNSPWK